MLHHHRVTPHESFVIATITAAAALIAAPALVYADCGVPGQPFASALDALKAE
jgi:hypothetical protein